LNTPSVAVAWCEELANDMAMFSRDAIGKAMSLVTNYDDQIAHIVRESEEMCDVYEDKLGSYMVKLSQTQMSSTDSRKVSTILHCLSDFERISDHAVNLVKAVEEVEQKNLQLSEVALADLRSIMRPVEEIVNIASDAFLRSDIELAVHVEPLEQVVDTLISQVKVRHVARLQRGECTILRGFVFSDMLTDLSRISDHCSNIAVCVIQMQRNSFDTHEYLNTVKKSDSSFSRQYNDYMEKYAILD
jgi:phosphate:Na+ symporter